MAKNKLIPYRKDLKVKARELRKDSTLSEILLWDKIKNRKIQGYQFHRQVPMLDYIVDFYCHELMLVIEIDSDSHDHPDAVKYDEERQMRLESWGVKFLRFDDFDVKKNLDWVLREIGYWVEEQKEHPPSPLKPPSRGESVVQAVFHEIISLLTFKKL